MCVVNGIVLVVRKQRDVSYITLIIMRILH